MKYYILWRLSKKVQTFFLGSFVYWEGDRIAAVKGLRHLTSWETKWGEEIRITSIAAQCKDIIKREITSICCKIHKDSKTFPKVLSWCIFRNCDNPIKSFLSFSIWAFTPVPLYGLSSTPSAPVPSCIMSIRRRKQPDNWPIYRGEFRWLTYPNYFAAGMFIMSRCTLAYS